MKVWTAIKMHTTLHILRNFMSKIESFSLSQKRHELLGSSHTVAENSVKFLDLCTEVMLQKPKNWRKQLKFSGNQKRLRTYTHEYSSLLSCKRQFSCNFQCFKPLEICNIGVCLTQLSKHIYTTNNTTVYRTETGKKNPKNRNFGYF